MKDRWIVEWKPGDVWGPFPPMPEFEDYDRALAFYNRVRPDWSQMGWRSLNQTTGEIREGEEI